ncbi:hypothetical protein ETB97_000507 [Aspergillus alliaceus]|uniref:Uncharacterized protein n=1 Tax=Petromyces alliaceus TaxID=209559 RepID=A0A5N6FP61_PETAA|nr:uncharacterized protein BDW43DRAFT_314065 [Aspergillus alliaceus]KAB8230383.1 hypothetical protein BDW43DRAFT_314065 [Aspergillus alliaceus]KAF5861194.1 hypothetical protein ETB97_000507 [Aspergillus burnettii]
MFLKSSATFLALLSFFSQIAQAASIPNDMSAALSENMSPANQMDSLASDGLQASRALFNFRECVWDGVKRTTVSANLSEFVAVASTGDTVFAGGRLGRMR